MEHEVHKSAFIRVFEFAILKVIKRGHAQISIDGNIQPLIG